jgi:hypothetical protein
MLSFHKIPLYIRQHRRVLIARAVLPGHFAIAAPERYALRGALGGLMLHLRRCFIAM